MRGRTFLLLAFLTATVLPNAAEAQLRGSIGGITSPFRAMLGRFGHPSPAPREQWGAIVIQSKGSLAERAISLKLSPGLAGRP